MILPYDTSMSYWMMAIPRFEWQAELPPADGPQATPGTTTDAGGLPDGSIGPATMPGVPAAAPAGAVAGTPGDPALEACMPRLRLVITGLDWVAVPFWSPRENPSWNVMIDGARDEDRQRTEDRNIDARQAAGGAHGRAASARESE